MAKSMIEYAMTSKAWREYCETLDEVNKELDEVLDKIDDLKELVKDV